MFLAELHIADQHNQEKGAVHKTLALVFNHCISSDKKRFIKMYIDFIKDYGLSMYIHMSFVGVSQRSMP